VFGFKPLPEEEIELTRTNNMGDNLFDPNWESTWSRWSVGLKGSNDTRLANMIAKRLNPPHHGGLFGLSEFLSFIRWSNSELLDFLLRVLDRVLGISKKKIYA